ncbi:MAG: helix-turn-helix domain-containing protein [Cyanobacteria bacterium P01_F01_bin.86]
MENPQSSNSQLSSASEYALILGAGASAAMSIAAQQVAAASLPVTALVAMGLLNRHRLDRQVKHGETLGPIVEEAATQQVTVTAHEVTSQPMPEAIAAQPHPAATIQQTLTARFSRRRDRNPEELVALQQISLQKIGAHLQQQRQKQSLSLHDIHEQTFIQVCMLKAIESGDLRTLPEPFYIRAFIKKYAAVLGLQDLDIVSDFPVA